MLLALSPDGLMIATCREQPHRIAGAPLFSNVRIPAHQTGIADHMIVRRLHATLCWCRKLTFRKAIDLFRSLRHGPSNLTNATVIADLATSIT